MCTEPSAIWPSGALGALAGGGWVFGAAWPACPFIDALPAGFFVSVVCAKAVLAANTPARAPTRTNRFMLASKIKRPNLGVKYTGVEQARCHGSTAGLAEARPPSRRR